MIDKNSKHIGRQRAQLLRGGAPSSFPIYTPLVPLELMGSLEGVVLIEFPDLVAAKAWYESPAYQKAKPHRDGAADTEFFIIDGGLVPLEDRLPHIKNREA